MWMSRGGLGINTFCIFLHESLRTEHHHITKHYDRHNSMLLHHEHHQISSLDIHAADYVYTTPSFLLLARPYLAPHRELLNSPLVHLLGPSKVFKDQLSSTSRGRKETRDVHLS